MSLSQLIGQKEILKILAAYYAPGIVQMNWLFLKQLTKYCPNRTHAQTKDINKTTKDTSGQSSKASKANTNGI